MKTPSPVPDRLAALRARMREEGIDAYLVPSDDDHGSEYVDKYFQCRAWLSGFTGSAGTLLVLADAAALWTDGRYFLQAEAQLAESGIELMRMGEPGVPALRDYLRDRLLPGQSLGFDARTLSAGALDALQAALEARQIRFRGEKDLVGQIWPDRPPFPARPVWELDLAYAGQSRADKLAALREAMRESGAAYHLLSSLADIAWLYNLRGGDVAYSPVFMAYTLLSEQEARLYVAPEAVSPALRDTLAADGVSLRAYWQVYEDVAALAPGTGLLLSRQAVNAALLAAVPEGVRLIDRANPTVLSKAKKNPVELTNIEAAHVQDGVALTKLLYWLRLQEATGRHLALSELDVAAKLLSLRQERPGFVEESFSPIVASGAHGAIIHYGATAESNAPLQDNSLLLLDTGGHYLSGSTDVTRTVAIGRPDEEQRRCYTAVLRGHLAIAGALFKQGCTGANLDLLARAPLWELGLDYRHGTGHGVGYLLNVHEGPHSLRLSGAGSEVAFEPGMILSDEPGVYLPGRFGVRIENLIVCREQARSEYGVFLRFDTLTLAPHDRRLIEPAQMSRQERQWLNAYHERVYTVLSPYLTPDERAWLREETRPIG